MTKEKGFVQVLLIIAIAAVVGVIGYVLLTNKPVSQVAGPVPGANQAQDNTQRGNAIQNSSDLKSASASLDATDTTQIDTQLNALDSASAGF